MGRADYRRFRCGIYRMLCHSGRIRRASSPSEAIGAYLGHFESLVKQGKRKASTFKERRRTLTAFASRLPADLFLSLVEPEDCDAFVTFGTGDEPLARQTSLGYYQRLGRFFTWCVEEAYLTENPMDAVDRPSVGQIVPKFLTPKQIEQLLVAIQHDYTEKMRSLGMDPRYVIWVHDWVVFLVSTALRPGEAQALLWENVDLDSGYLYVRNTSVHETKTGDEGTVPLPPQAIEVLARLRMEQEAAGILEPGGFVFRGPQGGQVNLSRAEFVIRSARRLARLPSYTTQRVLRASCASYLKKMGLSDGFISAVLRHVDPRTIKHYARLLMVNSLLLKSVQKISIKRCPNLSFLSPENQKEGKQKIPQTELI